MGAIFEFIIGVVAAIIATAIWAVGFFISLGEDIVGWIKGKIDELRNKGAKDVNVINGKALAEFLEQNKNKYPIYTLDDIRKIENSVINAAADGNGNIVEQQMIRSQGGLSTEAQSVFEGKPFLKIRL